MGCCNKAKTSKSCDKIKSGKILFGINYFLRDQIILKFCTEYASITAMLYAIFQNDQEGIYKQTFDVIFEFKTDLW